MSPRDTMWADASVRELRASLVATPLLGFRTRSTGNNGLVAKAAFVGGIAELQLTTTVDNATPNVGDTITFTIVVDNNGPGDPGSIIIHDLLPPGLTFVSSTTNSGSYNRPRAIGRSPVLPMEIREP